MCNAVLFFICVLLICFLYYSYYKSNIYMIDRFYQLLTEIWVARSPVTNTVNIVKSMSCGVKEIFQK